MVNVKELRIGNIAFVINCAPVVITADHIKSIANGDVDYSPLPLTPEWLERCGFVDEVGYWKYQGEPGFVLLKDNEEGLYIGNPVRTYVKTVHHLQNLYFALTEGVELNVKL